MGDKVTPCVHGLLTCWLLGTCRPAVGPLLSPCWAPFGPLLGPCWAPVGSLLGPCWPLLAPQTLTIKAGLIDCLIEWLVVQAKQGLRGEEAAGRLDLLGSNALPYKATSWGRLFVDECFRL